MSHTLKLNNFSIVTNEELSPARKVKLVSAVLAGRTLITTARLRTESAERLLQRPGVLLRHLSPPFGQHFRHLFRCTDDDFAFVTAVGKVAKLLKVLENGFCSPELRFIEYGGDLVTNMFNAVTSLFNKPVYQNTDVAITRTFSLSRPGIYVGEDYVDACANTGKATGNPNEIAIRLNHLDQALDEVIDTVVHESTHKFLGTEDEGMRTAAFGWMKDDGLALYIQNNPGVPLPLHTPGFLSKTPDQAIANAYILTAYILYMPKGDVASRTQLNLRAETGPLGTQTALGHYLRQRLAHLRPPDGD